MPLQATSGAASYDAFGGGGAAVIPYIEDVFSTYLYQGTSANQTITNGIDLSTKGGLVWCKGRPNAGYAHRLFDTARGVNNSLTTTTTAAQSAQTNSVTAFNTTGFSLGSDANGEVNFSGSTYVGWTFRKQPKFFDVVTFTGDGTDGRAIAHSLGSVPGCIIMRAASAADDWYVYHRSGNNGTNTGLGVLNLTAAFDLGSNTFGGPGNVPVFPTSTTFTIRNSINASGATYIAYIFAHNAGGFGLTGTDNVISCGSYTGTTAQINVNLGYEPQWLMVKRSNSTSNWWMQDVTRGWSIAANGMQSLRADLDSEEITGGLWQPSSTGFTVVASANGASNASGGTYIYIAIRRGPMKVPTTGSSVFGISARSGTGANATVTGGQTDDAILVKNRGTAIAPLMSSRLTGTGYLSPQNTDAEVAAGVTILQANPWDVMDGVKVGTTSNIINASGSTYINYLFKRAPSFMDVVCYTGNGVARTLSHNLTTVPQIMIVKNRAGVTRDWAVYTAPTAATNFMYLNATDASGASNTMWNDTTPTSSVFTVGTNVRTNSNTQTYIAYLFATCTGVSKVGSYTGNGTTQTIDCGLTAGARFVLIKRTDSTGDWYVYDTARGMTTLTDPYWLTNSGAAEVATLGSVTTVATGFAVNATILAAINTNAATYIFLAIA
jgi:hypothetical protein